MMTFNRLTVLGFRVRLVSAPETGSSSLPTTRLPMGRHYSNTLRAHSGKKAENAEVDAFA